MSITDLIRSRRSVRTFDGRPLSEEDCGKLQAYIDSLPEAFGVPVTFRILDAGEHDLSSPVIVGADVYVAVKGKRQTNVELAFGYSFEKLCLYALSLGVGTVMLAASISRGTFEKAMAVGEDEVMPCASPLGYPADKRSLREKARRLALRADARIAFDKLFFDGSFDRPLTEQAAGSFRDALEAVRWAPSATNKQPWRAVLDGERVHFYEKQTIPASPLGDIQKLDVGIGLAHFELTAREQGIAGGFVFDDPGLTAPEGTRYIITWDSQA